MASDIRAGRAFVEMLIKDESVQQSLDDVKARLRNFGAATEAVGTTSFTAMNARATASMAATAVSVGYLASSLAVVNAVIYAIGNAARVSFGIVTGSVLKAAGSLGAVQGILSRILPANNPLSRALSGFMGQSQTTEATGRWTRFFGQLTGNSALRDVGNRIERLGLGSSVVRSFQRGLIPGITGSIGATFRELSSRRSAFFVDLFLTPISLTRKAFSGLAAEATKLPAPLGQSGSAMGQIAAKIPLVNAGSGVLRGTVSVMRQLAGAAVSVALRFGGVAAAISGPALLAARNFVSTAQEMTRTSRQTGESLQSLINKKFGQFSFITPADITAASAVGKTMTEVKQQVSAAWAQIGVAALPVIQRMAEFTLGASRAITRFLADNRALIGTVVSVAARVAGAAGAIATVGAAIYAAGPLIAALLSPLGLVAAALVGIVLYFPQLRESAGSAISWLMEGFRTLGDIANETLGGILDALSAGSMEAAVRVLWAGINAAWLTGTAELRSIYRATVTTLASIGVELFAGLQSAWVVTVQFLGDAWRVLMRGLESAWYGTQNAIAGGFARVIAKLSGQNVDDVLATLTEMQDAEKKGRDAAYTDAIGKEEKLAAEKLKNIEAQRQAMQEALTEDLAAQETAAQQELQAAQEELRSARAAAAALKNRDLRTRPEVPALASSLSSGFGSFSSAAAGRIGAAGLSKLEEATADTATNTGEMVALLRDQKGLQFA